MVPATPLATLILDRDYKRGVEVGVWVAHSSRLILGLPPVEKLYMVDAWRVYKKCVGPQPGLDAMYDFVCSVTERFGERAEILRMFSVDAAKVVPKDLDFVFLDASHDYESVKEDIEAWRDHVRPGGVLSGDDYDLYPIPHSMEVHKVVDELFGDHVKFIPFVGGKQNYPYGTVSPDMVTGFPRRFWYVEYEDLRR